MGALFEADIIDVQKQLRQKISEVFSDFNIRFIPKIQSEKQAIDNLLLELIASSGGKKEEAIFRNEKVLVDAVFLLCEWCQMVLNGKTGAEAKRIAAGVNINLFEFDVFSHLELFNDGVKDLQALFNKINYTNFDDLKIIIDKFLELQHPSIAYLHSDSYIPKNYHKNDDQVEIMPETIVVSLEFYLHDTAWANPQVLKAKEIYVIKGILRFNKSPENVKTLKLLAATTSSDIFELNINDIILDEKLDYNVEGTLLFKYSQSNFEDNLSIKLVPYLLGSEKEELQPVIIGYDELNAKILDQNNNLFKTGFETIDKKVFEIYTNPLLAQMEMQDRNDFITLLNGITNFQGYCLQSGLYKHLTALKEDQFRDKLIQHLTANPLIGGAITKESHVAGGRVEIAYKGHIAELKVETSISDRATLIKKYSSQAVAYASGNGKSASIVCILDLTEKVMPPGPLASNVILRSAITHGFEQTGSEEHAQVFIFIDGNTKNPSEYSK
ncbi:hypothetical protein E6C50_02035 [Flavobacterium supellecticarium]|uniref:Uncharacterized protein n=1 Tax=Flavobacterium supellecticarium TaxID=2565924 RepID=A0A4S4A3J9_9FLAO|nr:hypothetical protein [Flavobacterium supellecticarium]THF53010.1 hypothetical protein E6C50_02035 [Flavobacterium supellecticarium]